MTLLKIIYFTSLLTFSTTLLPSTTTAVRTRSARAAYGQYCDNLTVRCDSTLSLTCKNESCACLKPETMIFDPLQKSCASLAGEKCKFIVMEDYRSWQEEMNCVTNAHCDVVRSICVCDKQFIELSNGTCVPKKSYGEGCDVNSDCKPDSSLICLDSKCVCNASTSEYSNILSQCVGLVNEACVNDQCTPNAICREESKRIYYGGSSVELDVSSDDYEYGQRDSNVGRCQCRTAFAVTSEGRCEMGYGGKCEGRVKCMGALKCRDGVCVCPYPAHQVFDKGTEECLSYVGGPCSIGDGGGGMPGAASCVGNTVCQKVGGSSRYECGCPKGFIENRNRSCDLDYNEKCDNSRYYGSGNKCDEIGKLFCVNWRCRCEDELHVYDDEIRSCRGLVGAGCLAGKDDCVDGAYCRGRRGGGVSGVCSCQEFNRETENRTCVMDGEGRGNKFNIGLKSGGGSSNATVNNKGNWEKLFDDEDDEEE